MTTFPDYLMGVASLTGKSAAGLLNGGEPLFRITVVDGEATLVAWDATLGPEPTIDQIVAAASAPNVAQLQAAANSKATALLSVVRTYSASGVTIQSDAKKSTITDWLALRAWAAQNPAAATSWVSSDNSVTSITAEQIEAIAPLVGGYEQTIYGELAIVLGEIASGAVTTLAQIAGYAWTV